MWHSGKRWGDVIPTLFGCLLGSILTCTWFYYRIGCCTSQIYLASLLWSFPSFVRALQSPHVPPRTSTVLPTPSPMQEEDRKFLKIPMSRQEQPSSFLPKSQKDERKSSAFSCHTNSIHRPSPTRGQWKVVGLLKSPTKDAAVLLLVHPKNETTPADFVLVTSRPPDPFLVIPPTYTLYCSGFVN